MEKETINSTDRLYMELALESIPFFGSICSDGLRDRAEVLYHKAKAETMDYYFHVGIFWFALNNLHSLGCTLHKTPSDAHFDYMRVNLTWKGRLQRLKQIICKEYE